MCRLWLRMVSSLLYGQAVNIVDSHQTVPVLHTVEVFGLFGSTVLRLNLGYNLPRR